jgi:chemotaxis protein CheX
MSDTQTEPAISTAYIVAAVQTATLEVFHTMLTLQPEMGEMLTEKSAAAAPASGVVSLVGLAGSWAGTGSLACTAEFACKLASSFLMAEYDSMNDEVLDAVGEISNMIIGNVKTILEEKLGSMGLSTPTVIFGRNFQTRSSRNHEWIVVPFDCDGERMFVQMCIAPSRDDHKTTVQGLQVPQLFTA